MHKDSLDLITNNLKLYVTKNEFLSLMALKKIKDNQVGKAIQYINDLKYVQKELFKYLEENLNEIDFLKINDLTTANSTQIPDYLNDLIGIKKMNTILSMELNSLKNLSTIELFSVCKLSVDLYYKNSRAYFNLFDYFYENNKILEAKEICNLLIDRNFQDEEAHRRLGDIYNFKLRDYKNAIKEYEYYASKVPNNSAVNSCLNELYEKSK